MQHRTSLALPSIGYPWPEKAWGDGPNRTEADLAFYWMDLPGDNNTHLILGMQNPIFPGVFLPELNPIWCEALSETELS